MDLKNFVSEAIVAIVDGVLDAQQRTKDKGAYVNPGGLMRTVTTSENATWDNRTNNFSQVIQFDVVVMAEESAGTTAKIGVLTGILGASAGGSSEAKEQSTSRLKFAVPILLPVVEVPKDARQRRE